MGEIDRLKQELAAVKESQAESTRLSSSGRRPRSCSMGGFAAAERALDSDSDEEEFEPLPPDSSCWDWPLSRHEKKARVQLLERQMNAMDKKALMQELCRGSCCSDSDSES